ncbi:MAG: amidophosphoribosyltransferase [Candidatus Schekmanbacteria bacterium]|nr:amidophosphoribosyltransferase [Candidatus Schekmanbacteria bacterium]
MYELHEECGVFGIYNHKEASNLTYLGLYALQHRGQESAGIVAYDGQYMHTHKGMGHVADVFDEEKLKKLPGSTAIGHVRYSTTGDTILKNVQPFVIDYARGSLAIAHNGNLVNAHVQRERLEDEGSIFQSTIDTEIIAHLIARSKAEKFEEALVDALDKVQGAYSLVLLTPKKLVGVRDPFGFRPLILGQLDGAYVLTSESCALSLIEATYIRDLEPGEIVVIDDQGLRSYKPFAFTREAFCVFEYIYFARPDSNFKGENVAYVRRELGRQLARETGVDADLVIPIPDSGIYAALGYAEQSRIPYEQGLVRNHYVGRTFIEPRQSIRHFGVKVKLNAVRRLIEGKRVIVVDDSIVRGTTSRKIIKMIRSNGAKEVHMRISAPPSKFPCFYGIDTPTRKELIAATHTLDEISRYLGTDSLGYLSLEGLLGAFKINRGFCTACFSGDYPIKFPWKKKRQLRLFEKV